MLLEGLAARLEQEADLDVAGVIADIEAAPTEISVHAVVFEVDSPAWPSDALSRVHNRLPAAKVVVLLTHPAASPPGPTADLNFVRASDSIDRLVEAVRSTTARLTPPQPPETLPFLTKPADPAEAALADLTPQQREIFIRLARGDSVKEIARALQATFKAVDCQKYRIMRKLGLNDRVQATRLAIRAGLLTP